MHFCFPLGNINKYKYERTHFSTIQHGHKQAENKNREYESHMKEKFKYPSKEYPSPLL